MVEDLVILISILCFIKSFNTFMPINATAFSSVKTHCYNGVPELDFSSNIYITDAHTSSAS